APGIGGLRQAIIEGRPHHGDDAVLHLHNGRSACTAALVAPRVVVMAKHCVYDAATQRLLDARELTLGAGPDRAHLTPYPGVTEVHAPPSACFELGSDIAFLVLSSPEHTSPYAIPTAQQVDLRVGDHMTGIDYGVHQAGFTRGQAPTQVSGSKRIAESDVDALGTHTIDVGNLTCNNDSGDPLF